MPVEREASIVLVLFFPVSSTSMVVSVGAIITEGVNR